MGVGATPGYTRAMQEVHIDKHVKLLDCPGIVFSESSSESDLVLRNCIKVEQITDTVKPGTPLFVFLRISSFFFLPFSWSRQST